MKTYVINGFLGEISGEKDIYLDHNKSAVLSPLREFGRYGTLYKLNYKSDKIKFVIRSADVQSAYKLGMAFRNVLQVFYGCGSLLNDFPVYYKMIEINDFNNDRFDSLFNFVNKKYYEHIEKEFFDREMDSGVSICEDVLNEVLNFINLFTEENMYYALESLSLSCSLIGLDNERLSLGCHVSKSDDEEVRKKLYYENKMVYESSFLNAFRAIEFILGEPSFDKKQVDEIFRKFRLRYSISDGVKFNSTDREEISYQDAIRSLKLKRDSVAGHGNSKPPEDHIIYESQINEIQSLCKKLFMLCMHSKKD